MWMLLESLFMQIEEVMKELPFETVKFREMDKKFKEILCKINETPQMLKFCN